MAQASKYGTDWADDELDAIVSDYFVMLELERAGRRFVKAHRVAALVQQIGRTQGSVEFKHMNISAVISELGVKPIVGYVPMANAQKTAIYDAIDRYLSSNSRILEWLPEIREYEVAESQTAIEEASPPLMPPGPLRPARLERLLRKFDPSLRDFRNRALGAAGEQLVFDRERTLLRSIGRPDLAREVRWISKEQGDGAGFDIRSFDVSGAERFIEVKTTCGGRTTPFFLTRNERSLSEERPEAFRIYRLYEFAHTPRLFHLSPPLEQVVILETETWRASFG